ncbi:hypothetical protein M5362_21670 [Streptomyces sp. Je 1-79]|uniref:hypothetical protein n=1 Tax=Streptomyces sp. Je 1-79 TaxID=2943847 RepID=UPI0021A4EFD3|nr:hypothetical protein [Streptomyces sp. Je 1-79]MCT4355752.1 hypothetical protein [Streptomyces sp. Je 1-79]
MRRARRLAAGLALAGALMGVTGCASSVDPIERLGRKAARQVGEPGAGEGTLSKTAVRVFHTLAGLDETRRP